jgi:hypothetical protein
MRRANSLVVMLRRVIDLSFQDNILAMIKQELKHVAYLHSMAL